MKTEEIQKLYDSEYARLYDERFLTNPAYIHVADYERKILIRLLSHFPKWLDVACGTGYFLSQFPQVERAGIDLSADMLNVAIERNQDALFLKQADFRDADSSLEGVWPLVSSMWGAYCYVESLTQFDLFLQNLCAWTSQGGCIYLPLIDLEDVLYWRTNLKHRNPDIQVFGGPCTVNGVLWSYEDSLHEKSHHHLLAIHIDYIKERLESVFSEVDILHYPPYHPPVPGQRKAILACGKNSRIGSALKATLATLRAESEIHRADALGMADLGKNTGVVQSAGWLRRLWRASPLRLRTVVRWLLGELEENCSKPKTRYDESQIPS